MSEQIVFTIFAFSLVGFSFYQYHSLRNALSATVLMVMTCAVLAFYMLQFGNLGSFTMKGLSAEASFIRDKSVEAQTNASKIATIYAQVEKDRMAIALSVHAVNESNEKIKRAELSINEAQAKIGRMQSIIVEAEEKLKEAQALADLDLRLLKLSNSNRSAFDELLALANNKSDPNSAFVQEALENASSNAEIVGFFSYEIDWQKEHIDLSTATLRSLIDFYERSATVIKPTIIRAIWDQERFPKGERLKFLANVIKETPNLHVLYVAMTQMNTEAHMDQNILGYRHYLEWWEQHEENYINSK